MRLHRAVAETKLALQRELAELSTSSDHRVLPNARHYIQLGHPEAVIDAFEDVMEAVRTGRRGQDIAASRSAE